MSDYYPNKHILSKERFHPIWYPWENLLRDKDRVSCRAKLTSVAIRAIEERLPLIKLNLGCYVDGSAPRARSHAASGSGPFFMQCKSGTKSEPSFVALEARHSLLASGKPASTVASISEQRLTNETVLLNGSELVLGLG